MSEIKRMSGAEREILGTLGVADQIVTNAVRDLREERYKLVPNLKRDLRLCQTALDRLLLAFVESVPKEQRLAYVRTLRDTSYTTGVRCRARYGNARLDDEYGMYLTFSQINGLMNAAREKCMLCGLDTEGQRRCPLRKVLDEIPNDAPDSDGCPYYGVI